MKSEPTMSETVYFVECSIAQSDYLIECTLVREVICLPELTSISGAASYHAGLLNLRGEVIEVVEGRTLLNHSAADYQLSDKIVVLHQEQLNYGLLVQSTQSVHAIPHSHIEAQASAVKRGQEILLESVAHTPTGLIPILNPSARIKSISEQNSNKGTVKSFIERIREQDRPTFLARAEALKLETEVEDGNSLSYAVIELDGEFYGISLEQVTEFLEIDSLTPVPCCPAHVVGNANWRGDVLTVIDVSSELDLSRAKGKQNHKVVVFGQKRDAVGVVVDEIYDVCHLNSSRIVSPPNTLKATRDGYLTGIAEHKERKLGILCIEGLLAGNKWRVHEVV